MERLRDLPDGTHVRVETPLNFSVATADGQNLTASTSSAATSIDASGASDNVMVYNSSPVTIFIKCGTSGVTATTASMPVLAGEKGTYYKGSATHIALLAASGSGQTIWVKAGEGS